MSLGTDVNFGSLTRNLFKALQTRSQIDLHTSHMVTNLEKNRGGWNVFVEDKKIKERKVYSAKFVFIGAGGAALTLLKKSGIPEGKKYGGFPVNGNFLICTNKNIIKRHHAKVYGIPSIATPPMSVPHLDTRIIKGEKGLLFGPFAGFSTKFLKHGSYLDFPKSLHADNIVPIVSAGLQNLCLTAYLIRQVTLSPKDRIKALQEFLPKARLEDWYLHTAGQRVQIIKNIPGKGGVLQFGTEVVTSSDGSLAALLGASPGASTSVSIMLELLGKCFTKQKKSRLWQKKLKEMIPSFGRPLSTNPLLCKEVRSYTTTTLQLHTM